MRHTGLRRRFLIILALTFSLIMGISIAGTVLLRDRLHDQILSENEIFIRSYAHLVERVLQEPYTALLQLTYALEHDFSYLAERVGTRLRVWPYFENIHLIDPRGRVQLVVPPDPRFVGTDLSQTEYFSSVDANQKPCWSQVSISPRTGLASITIAIPYRYGVVAGVVCLEQLADKIGKINSLIDGHLSVVDRVGTYIIHRDPLRVQQRESATRFLFERNQLAPNALVKYRDQENGTNCIVMAQSISPSGWSLIMTRSGAAINAPFTLVISILVPFIAVLVFLVWMAFCRMFRGVLASVQSFTAQAIQIAGGDFTGAEVSVDIDEFTDMAGIFNEMKRRIILREREIVESEERYRALVEFSPEAIMVVQEDNLVFVNPAAVKAFRAEDAASLLAQQVHELFPRQERSKYQPYLAGTFGTVILIKASLCLMRLDGTVFEVELSSIPFVFAGKPSVLVIINDVSERRRIERELDEINRRFRDAVESMEDGLWDWNIGDDSQYISARYCQIFGYTLDEMPKRKDKIDWISLVHPNDRQHHDNNLKDFLANPEQGYRCEMRMRHRSGQWLSILSRGRMTQSDSLGRPVRITGTIMDMTTIKKAEKERLHLQTQLRQEQKLSSVGTLANGVAHEINNPLMGMINYAQLLLDRIPEQEETWREWVGEIINEGLRISEIVRNLLAFSRQSDARRLSLQASHIITSILSLTKKLFEKDEIQTQLAIDEDVPSVFCSDAQIQQVLLNLLTNARDALNARYPEYSPDKIVSISLARLQDEEGDWVRITVADRGLGVPEEAVESLFDPFFTTKPVGKGTGLGLSISYGIIKDHGGRLTFEKNHPRGAVFSIDLPVYSKAT